MQGILKKRRHLQGIGDKYGLTRERVRQIYNRFFKISYKRAVARKRQIYKQDLSCATDPRNQVAIRKSQFKLRAMASDNFLRRCKEHSFVVEACSYPYTVNGYKVALYYSSQAKPTVKGCSTCLYYRFQVRDDTVADFAVFAAEDFQNYFIVPMEEVPRPRCIYIRSQPSSNQRALNLFWEYYNHFDQLDVALKEAV